MPRALSCPSSWKQRICILLFALIAVGGYSGIARAVPVERIVAVVGDRPILLSELRQRGKPERLRILAQAIQQGQLQGAGAENFLAAAETEMYRALLSRMIDERLEELAAAKANLSVTPEEVDRGIENLAGGAHVTAAELLAEVLRTG